MRVDAGIVESIGFTFIRHTMKRTKATIQTQELETMMLDALGSSGYLLINKNLILKLGLLDAAIFSNYIDKHKYWKSRDEDFDGWFFLTFEAQKEELHISDYTLRQAKARFLKLKLLRVKRKGIPAKEYYKLDLGKIVKYIYPQKSISTLVSSDSGTLETSDSGTLFNNNKDNKTKLKNNTKKFSSVIPEQDPFHPILQEWLEYKTAKKQSYASERSVQAFLTKLKNLSNNNPDTAQAIIEESMANNWAGVFALQPNNKTSSPQKKRAYDEDVEYRKQMDRMYNQSTQID